MKCERIRELMSAYIDNEINEVDKIKFERHITECPHCKEEYELLKEIVSECSNINEVELPENFREELNEKLQKAKESKSRRFSNFIRRNRLQAIAGSAVAVILIFAITLNGFNISRPKEDIAQSSELNYGDMNGDYSMQADIVAPNAPRTGGANRNEAVLSKGAAATDGGNNKEAITVADSMENIARKIIRNGNISLKVLDIQSNINDITTMTEQLGGYVESSYVEDINVEPSTMAVVETEKNKETITKMGNITIKIPADKFDSSFKSIIAMGTIVNQSTNSSDITKQYMDMESRINNLKVQEKTYQDLLAIAKNVDEILRIETELNRIRTDIDIMIGDLKRWDEEVEYSTININLTQNKETEIEKVDTSSVWNRAKKGLINTINSIKNGMAWLFVFLVSALPYILIFGGGTALAIYFIKKRK